ncbi:MAG: hypothetical protein HYY22_09395 [Thaumarchaeota archaeon]|nr:hypothetical protein [Nitrososphaerota archaeon]
MSQIGFQFYNQTESFTSCGAGAIGALQIPARPISMPAKFNMSYEPIGRCSTTRVHYLGALLAAKVPYLVNITSTAPVNFMLVKGTGNNSSELSYETYQARTILDKSQVTSFNQNLTVNQTGLYIFVFRVDKALPVATLDFFVRPANVLVVTTTSTTTTNKTVTMISTATTTLRTNITVTSTATIQNNVTSTDTTTFVERVTEPSIYAWALGATVIAAILAVVALRGRKTSISSNYEEK